MKRQLLTLSALALTSFALVACNSTKEASTKDSSQPSVVKASSETSQSSSVKTSATKKEYALGEKINLEDKAEVTIKSVAYTDERNQFSDAQPDKVIVVTYDVTNLSEDDYFVGSELTLYINGKKWSPILLRLLLKQLPLVELMKMPLKPLVSQKLAKVKLK